MAKYHGNGIGQLLGDDLVTGEPLITGGSIWYVHSTNGVDSAGYGVGEENPMATLAYAVAAAVAGDIIVLLDGHNETITTEVTLSLAALVVVGAGKDGNNRPTVKLKWDTSSGDGTIQVTAADIEIRNVWFEVHTSFSVGYHLSMESAGWRLKDCVFECSTLLSATSVQSSASGEAKYCEWISTETNLSAPPVTGLNQTAGALILDSCIFDGGISPWSNAAFSQESALPLRVRNPSLLNGADFKINSSSNFYMLGGIFTGNSEVNV
jgi:hypothetical protein